MTTPSVVLFDIDGTLLSVHGVGKASFAAGLAAAFGIVDDLHDISFAGATDLRVLSQLRTRLPIPTDDDSLRRFFDAMNEALHQSLQRQAPLVYPGVIDALNHLSDQGHALALVTGNARSCAMTKLSAAGIDPKRFTCGGYGDEHHDRNHLAALAVKRAAARPLALIGDTPSDVAAAKHVGALAIAVTTGSYDRPSLLAAGADAVSDNLWTLLQTQPLG
jgi:phosphoglycolate phosphatase